MTNCGFLMLLLVATASIAYAQRGAAQVGAAKAGPKITSSPTNYPISVIDPQGYTFHSSGSARGAAQDAGARAQSVGDGARGSARNAGSKAQSAGDGARGSARNAGSRAQSAGDGARGSAKNAGSNARNSGNTAQNSAQNVGPRQRPLKSARGDFGDGGEYEPSQQQQQPAQQSAQRKPTNDGAQPEKNDLGKGDLVTEPTPRPTPKASEEEAIGTFAPPPPPPPPAPPRSAGTRYLAGPTAKIPQPPIPQRGEAKVPGRNFLLQGRGTVKPRPRAWRLTGGK